MAIPATLDWQIYDADGRRKYLNRAETIRFLEAADRFAPLYRALCYLLVFSGCRISEAISVRLHQLDAEQGRVVFRTLKQRKTVFRAVLLPPEVMDMLLALVPGTDGRLFPITRITAWRFVAAAMEVAGIGGAMASPKGLRHAFGIRSVLEGVPPGTLQGWMGHTSLNTTMVYVQAVGAEQRQFAERTWRGLLHRPMTRAALRASSPTPWRECG
ncbi:tyrosine-type recombinase/integrase [Nitrospirillum pindoramense]|uniref:Phage integrase family protein n=1 Tax=Nitrospirillum amazonense TaxID=28077 RepID=A0A560GK36_9PROT|nr:site-specific integrase [Nitrospirillum amazonense]TWB34338.1 phage integrase family protein [Nitrospirillum amazonense]